MFGFSFFSRGWLVHLGSGGTSWHLLFVLNERTDAHVPMHVLTVYGGTLPAHDCDAWDCGMLAPVYSISDSSSTRSLPGVYTERNV